MRNKVALIAIGFCLMFGISSIAQGFPTGAPLLYFPVQPCRILDTRVSLGPLFGQSAMDVYVRGSNLLASDGAGRTNCDVPPEAEVAMVNITVVSATTNSYLRANATGWVLSPNGMYSRMSYRAGQNDSNELAILLCNAQLFPLPQVPCGGTNGRYNDFQVKNMSPDTSSSFHLVADVVGYFKRAE